MSDRRLGPHDYSPMAYLVALGAEYLKLGLYAGAILVAVGWIATIDARVVLHWRSIVERPVLLAIAATVLFAWVPVKVLLNGNSRLVSDEPGRFRSPILTALFLLVVTLVLVVGAMLGDPVAGLEAALGGG